MLRGLIDADDVLQSIELLAEGLRKAAGKLKDERQKREREGKGKELALEEAILAEDYETYVPPLPLFCLHACTPARLSV